MIAVMDKIRDTTIKSIDELKRSGIRTEMITGDNERTARAIAREIGIDEYHAELLPDDKVNMIGEHLAEDYGGVAMVGDGVNDAPALARANVGIAMGAIGSDVSLETADIALMQDDLTKIPYLIELSKKTMAIVRQNVIVSIIIKATFAILAFPGLVTLWLAVAVGDMGLSLAVILNAMRLSFIKSHGLSVAQTLDQ
jgi:Cd2+/Zn2+-exporting ATPase